MANLNYVTQNKLTKEVNAQKASAQKMIFAIGFVIAMLGFLVNLMVGFAVLLITAFLCVSQKGSDRLKAGAIGEDIALNALKGLPDSYTIYNQVDIPNKKSRTGVNEADLLVVGPQAIFVIEVKHNKGKIVGGDKDQEWTATKIGRRGTRYSKNMRNPIAQVKKLVWLLSEELKRSKRRAWIQGIVLFSNAEANVSVANDSNVPVLTNADIVNYILSY